MIHTVEVENQISTLLLEIRRAESAARGYLLTSSPQFLADHEKAYAAILPGLNELVSLTSDNPVQVAHIQQLRPAVEARMAEFVRAIDFVKRNDISGGVDMLRNPGSGNSVQTIATVSTAMRAEEDRLLKLRSASADNSQSLSTLVTSIGSIMLLMIAALSIFLVQRASFARDSAEQSLRDSHANLETAVDERTADLQEANEEIQRFAYIVSHDLRSPLVNIMGFTSELDEARAAIFGRIAKLTDAANASAAPPDPAAEPKLAVEDQQLYDEVTEAIGFIKSSIGKMDRLINAILSLTREGRREFRPERIDVRVLIEGIADTVAHQTAEANAEIRVEPLPELISDRLALEQIFSNLIDNALKYLKAGVPGDILVKGRRKLGYIIYDVKDNGRGIDPKDHQRIFELFRRAGTQDRPGQGIGLAHVRALVRRLGGTLSVTSELNEGSTFTVMLPTRWTLASEERKS